MPAWGQKRYLGWSQVCVCAGTCEVVCTCSQLKWGLGRSSGLNHHQMWPSSCLCLRKAPANTSATSFKAWLSHIDSKSFPHVLLSGRRFTSRLQCLWDKTKMQAHAVCCHTGSTHFFPEPHLYVILMVELHPPHQNAVALHVHHLWNQQNSSEVKKIHKETFMCLCWVIRCAEPCSVVFCRKVGGLLWSPWWSCHQSFPAAASQHKWVMQLLHLHKTTHNHTHTQRKQIRGNSV